MYLLMVGFKKNNAEMTINGVNEELSFTSQLMSTTLNTCSVNSINIRESYEGTTEHSELELSQESDVYTIKAKNLSNFPPKDDDDKYTVYFEVSV